MNQKHIMIIAGEASGDMHGANLVRAIQRMDSSLSFCGIGGIMLRNAGVEILIDSAELSVVGIFEVLSKLTPIRKALKTARDYLADKRPDLLILIDFPDFNFLVAKTAKSLAIPVLYYISPQIWAWRSGRVRKVKKLVDHMAVILPFEEAFYRKHHVPATFVGHPLLDNHTERSQNPLTIGLLPGSRDGEVRRHLPVMLESAQRLTDRYDAPRRNDIKFLISQAGPIPDSMMSDMVAPHQGKFNYEIVKKGASQVFERSALLVTASGTVTLEAALAGVPMVVIYKVSPLSYLVGKMMVHIEHISLVNLIAGRRLVNELIQHEATPYRIATAVSHLIDQPDQMSTVKKELLMLRNKLGGEGASRKVAEIAIETINRHSKIKLCRFS